MKEWYILLIVVFYDCLFEIFITLMIILQNNTFILIILFIGVYLILLLVLLVYLQLNVLLVAINLRFIFIFYNDQVILRFYFSFLVSLWRLLIIVESLFRILGGMKIIILNMCANWRYGFVNFVLWLFIFFLVPILVNFMNGFGWLN